MPKTSITMLVLAGLLAGVSGCDSQASQQAEAQRHLDAALAKLGRANAGYVASPDEQQAQAELLVYRQETMDAAFEDLNKVMSLNAPDQKMQAMRLTAEINASSARYTAREAAIEQAALAGRSTVLLGYVSAMESASSRAASLEPMTEQQIAKLQQEIDNLATKKQTLTAEIDKLDRQMQTVSAEIQQFRDRASEGDAQAQALREKAFVASGDKMYDLQDQAAELERKAAVESASADQQQVVADDLAAKLQLARVQLDTVNKLTTELGQQVQNAQADTARLSDQADLARQAQAEAAKVLADEYRQLSDVYTEAIEKRMTLASEKAAKVIETLEQVSGQARTPNDKSSVKLQLLSAYVDQAHIATSYAAYAQDLAVTTESLLDSVTRVQGTDTELYTSQLGKLTDAQVAARDTAQAAIDAGLTLADEIAPEDTVLEEASDSEKIAIKQKARLNDYKNERLDSLSSGS